MNPGKRQRRRFLSKPNRKHDQKSGTVVRVEEAVLFVKQYPRFSKEFVFKASILNLSDFTNINGRMRKICQVKV